MDNAEDLLNFHLNSGHDKHVPLSTTSGSIVQPIVKRSTLTQEAALLANTNAIS